MRKNKINIREFTGRLARFCLVVVFALFYVFSPNDVFAFTAGEERGITASLIVPPLADSDCDRIPDEHDLNPNDPDDAYADSDEDIINSDGIAVTDGLTNLEEHRLGANYNPLISNSRINARIAVSATGSLQPLDVALTAKVTDDGGYDIVKYEWDFDGNGTYDYSSRDPSVTYKYTAPGPNDEGGKRVYYPKLRVINKIGNAGVTTATINVERNEDISPPIAYPAVVIPPDISTPSKWQFKGDATDDKGIAKYQWDLTGNGEYDFTSTKSGSVTHTYKTTNPGSVYAHFGVTDTSGYSEIGTVFVGLDVSEWYEENRNLRPVIEFETEGNNRYVIYKKAGQQVTLRGSATPLGYKITKEDRYGYVKKLEWDFEGDGIYDWAMDENDPEWKTTIAKGEKTDIKHTYGAPGIYRATLRATTDLEPPHDVTITATDHILVIVEDGGNPPEAKAEAEYNKLEKQESVEGIVSLKVTFIHKESSHNPKKFEWDFDGDKRFDWIGTKPNSKNDKPVYTYTMPGYYLACLRVTDKDGLTDTDYIPVFVSMPDTYASAITMPEENQTIAGNNVTLACDVFPDTSVDTVMFQYRAASDAIWNPIGLGKSITSYMTTWDITGFGDGKYELRAIVNGDLTDTKGERYGITEIEVDAINPDIYEVNNNGIHSKKIKIDSDKSNSIILYNGTRIDIPIGAIPEDETITINESTIGFSTGMGNAINVEIEGEGKENYTFLKDITITMPYSDGDLDGRNENDLVIMWNNNGTWEPLYDSVVHPDENFVSAKVNHLSLFGAGFITWGAAVLGAGSALVGKGAVSYCFIATAAYGSSDAGDVMILREFRDRFLLTNLLGRRFVDNYYKYSPPMAEYIKDKPALKKITRLALKPLARFARWKLKEAKPPSIRGEEDAE